MWDTDYFQTLDEIYHVPETGKIFIRTKDEPFVHCSLNKNLNFNYRPKYSYQLVIIQTTQTLRFTFKDRQVSFAIVDADDSFSE